MSVQELKEKYGTTMTPDNAAAELKQHPAHIRSLCAKGDLPAIRIGRRWHINTEKFAKLLEGCGD